MIIVDSALKAANVFHKTKKDLEKEICNLKKQIETLSKNKHSNENFERLKFNEGAFWIMSRVVNEIEIISMKIDEIKSDFDKRISSLSFDTELNKMILSNAKLWLFGSVNNSLKDLSDLLYSWKDVS